MTINVSAPGEKLRQFCNRAYKGLVDIGESVDEFIALLDACQDAPVWVILHAPDIASAIRHACRPGEAIPRLFDLVELGRRRISTISCYVLTDGHTISYHVNVWIEGLKP